MRQTPPRSRAFLAAAMLILAATVAQLAVATFAPGIDRFEGKAFGARLLAYPLMMLLVPALWWIHQRAGKRRDPAPWGAFALIMVPFLIDVTGNTLDLYDTVVWWDDLNHFMNWIPLSAGVGILLTRDLARRWHVVLMVAGIGALLAVGWELGEWYTFIRHGTELDTAYEDTLGDEALGTTGGLVAGLLVAYGRRLPDSDA